MLLNFPFLLNIGLKLTFGYLTSLYLNNKSLVIYIQVHLNEKNVIETEKVV